MTPEHVEESEHGRMCKHCLSTVDGDGYAIGEQEQMTPFEGEETEQQSSTVAMRHNAGGDFANAVKRYAEGGEVEKPKSAEAMVDESIGPADAAKKALEDMKRRKAERYGRMGR